MPKIFEVGGCVRDSIMGIESNDIDFTFVLDDLSGSVDDGFAAMTSWLLAEGFTIFLSTPECFTIRAKFPKGHANEGTVADFVMARKELGLIEGTRRQTLALGTLEDDLARRDFTVNAIAEDEAGNLIDPFNGLDAIRRGVLVTPLDPMITLMDDPLRMLRALRFSITKGFDIDSELGDAMINSPLLDRLIETVSGERIREELNKMLAHDTLSSIRLLTQMDEELPGFLDVLFSRGLRLEATFKKVK